MKESGKRFAAGFLALLLLLLLLTGAVNFLVDPCLYYRLPEGRDPVFFNERYQASGMARHVEADTVLLGSSMAANYRAGDIGETFGGRGLRITIPDGRFREFDAVMELLFRKENPPRRIILVLDPNILFREDEGGEENLPAYLYDENPLNDIQYLLSKDTLYYSALSLKEAARGGGESLDEGFTWDKNTVWSREMALQNYRRPELAAEELPEEALFPALRENLATVERWTKEHPETEFMVFFPPYSILFWDKCIREGRLEAELAALELAGERLLALPNVRLFGFLFDEEIVTDLNQYCDYIHHSGAVSHALLGKLQRGEGEWTPENLQETLESWRDFVLHYDYMDIWS